MIEIINLQYLIAFSILLFSLILTPFAYRFIQEDLEIGVLYYKHKRIKNLLSNICVFSWIIGISLLLAG